MIATGPSPLSLHLPEVFALVADMTQSSHPSGSRDAAIEGHQSSCSRPPSTRPTSARPSRSVKSPGRTRPWTCARAIRVALIRTTNRQTQPWRRGEPTWVSERRPGHRPALRGTDLVGWHRRQRFGLSLAAGVVLRLRADRNHTRIRPHKSEGVIDQPLLDAACCFGTCGSGYCRPEGEGAT